MSSLSLRSDNDVFVDVIVGVGVDDYVVVVIIDVVANVLDFIVVVEDDVVVDDDDVVAITV